MQAWVKVKEKEYIILEIKTPDDFLEGIVLKRLFGEGSHKLVIMILGHRKPDTELRTQF